MEPGGSFNSDLLRFKGFRPNLTEESPQFSQDLSSYISPGKTVAQTEPPRR